MNKEEWRMQRTNPSRLQTGLRRLRLDWVLYALLLPTLVYFPGDSHLEHAVGFL